VKDIVKWIACALVVLSLQVGGACAQEQRTPLDDARNVIEQLSKQGKDVSTLKTELEQLQPAWDEIQKMQQEMMELQKKLQGKVDAFRPRMEAFGKKAQGVASGER
jgi:Skp family chaperone for outer membrane proteins